MSDYEIYSLILQITTAIAAGVFAVWQIKINERLKKLNDFVAVAITPHTEFGCLKLINSGKLNLYIHGFEMNNILTMFDKGRLLSVGTLDASYYWIPIQNIPLEGLFDIKVYLKDEFDQKYITEGQGQSKLMDETKIEVTCWTFKTVKNHWNIS